LLHVPLILAVSSIDWRGVDVLVSIGEQVTTEQQSLFTSAGVSSIDAAHTPAIKLCIKIGREMVVGTKRLISNLRSVCIVIYHMLQTVLYYKLSVCLPTK